MSSDLLDRIAVVISEPNAAVVISVPNALIVGTEPNVAAVQSPRIATSGSACAARRAGM
jgi:hypothetical protein